MPDYGTSGHDIIVIGASAGGVEALVRLVEALPSNFPAALFVVVHFPTHSTSVLPQILSRCGDLPALHPGDGERIQPGRIYVAPPDYHLLLRQGFIRLGRGPRENGHRPAIDSLFRSAARAYGNRVVGVVLTGMLDDGTAGLAVIKSRGGLAIVQDPDEALFSAMPRSAIEHVAVDYVLKVADIAPMLVEKAYEPVKENGAVAKDENGAMAKDELELEAEIVAQNKARLEQGAVSGHPSPLTCPECGGVLWELHQDNLIRFRCHVGHAYSLDSLLTEQADSIETALWSAVRALEEKAALAQRMATQAYQQNRSKSADQFRERAQEAKQQADLVRQVIQQHQDPIKSSEKNRSIDRSVKISHAQLDNH